MEADRRLAGPGPALDDERRVRLCGDQVVLVGLDRRHDVAHPLVARLLQLFEQEVVDEVASPSEPSIVSSLIPRSCAAPGRKRRRRVTPCGSAGVAV